MIRIHERPHEEARRLAATGAPVYLFVNPIEYHGPHLSLRNDGLIAAALATRLHERLARAHPDWPFVVAAELELGVDPCAGPGSRRAPYAHVRDAVREACRALAALGARRVLLMTFHGAPRHCLALQAGIDLLADRGVRAAAPFNLLLRELLEPDPAQYEEAFAGLEPGDRAALVRDVQLDFHAGFFETSVALECVPETVAPAYRDVPPCPPVVPAAVLARAARLARTWGARTLALELRLAAGALAWQRLRPFPGYTGRPHLASPEAGKVFTRAILDRYEACVEAVFAGRAPSPAPIFPWLRPL